MPFENTSVDVFFMFDVLHHIGEPRKFFAEADRCLAPAGRIVMIEPANNLLGMFMTVIIEKSSDGKPVAR